MLDEILYWFNRAVPLMLLALIGLILVSGYCIYQDKKQAEAIAGCTMTELYFIDGGERQNIYICYED
jgi:hypothetical protein